MVGVTDWLVGWYSSIRRGTGLGRG